jgi:hypothetical protein
MYKLGVTPSVITLVRNRPGVRLGPFGPADTPATSRRECCWIDQWTRSWSSRSGGGSWAQIITEGHTASGDDLPRMIAGAVGLVGMTAQMYLVDLAQRTLWLVPKDHRGRSPLTAVWPGAHSRVRR